jgi:hypothetical protein
MMIRTFGWALCSTAASLALAFVYGGWPAVALCVILGVLEVSLSFDNAVVNAKLVERMSEFWQKVFLTAGLAIAVFGMRLLFPLLVVAVTADLGPVGAVRLAMQKGDPKTPGTYGYILMQAHPQIAAFGGLFLLMLFLDFVLEDREISWLRWLERPLAWAGRLEQVSVVVAVVALLLTAELFAERPYLVMVSGALGIVAYLVVNGLGALFEAEGEKLSTPRGGPIGLVAVVGKAAFFLFLYLEVLDASFSFDGVVGAFAVTADPIMIAIGLGLIGAVYVRSMTVFLVRKGTLHEYVYLEHGAHWAIGALALILLCSVKYSVSQVVTGLVGIAFIGAALISSTTRRRRTRSDEPEHARHGDPVLQGSTRNIGIQ